MTDLGLRNLGKTKTLTLYKVEQSYVLFHLFSYISPIKNGYQEAVTLLIAVIFYNHELIISNHQLITQVSDLE